MTQTNAIKIIGKIWEFNILKMKLFSMAKALMYIKKCTFQIGA